MGVMMATRLPANMCWDRCLTGEARDVTVGSYA
jgi:hypothetical protein